MKTVTVRLHVKTLSGRDSLNNPVYDDAVVDVPGVLIGHPSTEELLSSVQLYGKRTEYMLGLPKGDDHIWTDTEVEFFGRTFRTFGDVIEGIEANVPTPWHKQVRVESHG